MNRYEITITLDDGDILAVRVVAEDQEHAIERVMETDDAVNFIGEREIDNMEFRYLGPEAPVSDDPDRFVLQKSAEDKGWWVATNKPGNIVAKFKEGLFNETVKITALEDASPLEHASAIRELSEWLAYFHADLVSGDEEEVKGLNRLRIGRQIRLARIGKNLTVRQLAELSGVPFQNITKIENGKYNVSIDILNKICRALGLKIYFSAY